MIATTDKTQAVVKDLIIINNDRCEGYKTAAQETKDADLKSLFTRFSTQSNQFNTELKRFMSADEAPKEGETKNSGKLYRAWMDIKAAVTANDRKGILNSCEFGEDVALHTYKDALEEHDIPEEIRITVRKQKNELQEAHNSVKSLRDRS
ncbi:MAG: PA2169 family four-helix-bundle protein [Bacteroidia bacterium]|nr:PA2169 family four-helix-bundle protein [Bacteroidia bacterium]